MANPESASNPDENKTPEPERPAETGDSAAGERRDVAVEAEALPEKATEPTAAQRQDAADSAEAARPVESQAAEQPEAAIADEVPAAEPEASAAANEVTATEPEPPAASDTPGATPAATPGPIAPQLIPPAVSPPTPTGGIPVATVPPTGVFMAPPVAPKSGLRQYRVLIGVGLAVVLIVAASLAFVLLGGSGGGASGAEAKVESYFDALSRKDGKAAGKLVADIDREAFDRDGANGKGLDSPFWKDSALKSGYRPPTDVEVVDSRVGPIQQFDEREGREYAQVTVAYNVGDYPGVDSFTLERGPDSGWTIVAAEVGNMLNPADAFKFEIAGVDTDDGVGFSSLILPPGGYDLSITDSRVFEDLDSELVVTPGSPDGFGSEFLISSVGLEVRGEVIDEIKGKVSEVIDECADIDYYSTYDYNCDWETPDGDSIGSSAQGTYDVTTNPEVDVIAGYTGWGEVVTVEPAEATVTEYDGYADDEVNKGDKVLMYFSGEVTVDDSGNVSWSGMD